MIMRIVLSSCEDCGIDRNPSYLKFDDDFLLMGEDPSEKSLSIVWAVV